MRGVVTPFVLLGVLVMVLTGCRTASDDASGPVLELACSDPWVESLGVPTVEQPARFATSGGLLRFTVSSLPPGSILGDVNDTEVRLGDINTPSDIRYRATSSPQRPGVIEVDAGTYSVVNSHRGRIDVEACDDVTLSEIEPSLRGPRSSPSTGSVSPTPGGPVTPPADEGTPGTSPSG